MPDTLQHAAGKGPQPFLSFRHAAPPAVAVHLLLHLPLRQKALLSSQVLQIFFRGKPWVIAHLLRQVSQHVAIIFSHRADVFTVKKHCPVIRTQQIAEQADQCGLTRPIGAEQSDDAMRYFKIDMDLQQFFAPNFFVQIS